MELVNYDLNTAAVAKMSGIYMKLNINGIDDVQGAAEVHSAKIIVVKHRTAIHKLRLSTNKDAQDFIKTNNKNAAVLIDLLAPIEAHLNSEEGRVSAEQERIATEKKVAEELKTQKRVTALFAVDVNIPYFDASMLDDAGYKAMLNAATEIHQAKQLEIEEEKKAKATEEKRLAEEKAAQEAEAKRLADIQTAQDAKEHELKEQQEAIEDEKRRVREAKDRGAFERQAKIQAAKDAKAQSEKEAKEKAKKEKAEAAEKIRKMELAPDREKLKDLAMTIRQIISPPAIKNETAREIVENVLGALAVIADNIIIQAKEL